LTLQNIAKGSQAPMGVTPAEAVLWLKRSHIYKIIYNGFREPVAISRI
jgi:hypothetical protein